MSGATYFSDTDTSLWLRKGHNSLLFTPDTAVVELFGETIE